MGCNLFSSLLQAVKMSTIRIILLTDGLITIGKIGGNKNPVGGIE
jgi:hypothetical protein